jgi:signal transduction histidine kinase
LAYLIKKDEFQETPGAQGNFAKYKELMFIAIVVIIYIATASAGALIGGVPKGSLEYSSLQMGEIEEPLPIFQKNKNFGTEALQGSIVVQVPDYLTRPTIYIPDYTGELRLWIDGREVSGGDYQQASVESIAIVRDLIVELGADALGKTVNLHLSLSSSSALEDPQVVKLSKVYLSEFSEIVRTSKAKKVYYFHFRPALVFSFFLLVVTFTIFILVGAVSIENFPFALFVLFFAAQLLGALSHLWEGFALIHQASFSFTLFAMMMLKSYVDLLNGVRPSRSGYFIYVGAFLFGIFGLILFFLGLGKFDVFLVNLLFHIPLMLLGFVAVAARALFSRSQENEVKLFFISVMSFSWAVILFDSLLRYAGILDLNVYLPAISSTLLYVTLGYSFSTDLIKFRNDIKRRQSQTEAALFLQEKKLKKIFAKSIMLREREVTAKNYARIQNDLHDGILTYLFIIMSLSDRVAGSEASKIRSISQFCVNEIRVILSSEVSGTTPLILSLASYRHHLFDSLSDLGVETEWDVKCLMDLGPTDLRFNLEIIRIIQEAVHNAVQRSSCTKLSVKASLFEESTMLQFDIINEGGRTLLEDWVGGIGIESMNVRVKRLDGNFSIVPREGGAHLKFVIPLGSRLR